VIRLGRGIIKLVRSRGGDLEDYRYYSIARHFFALRSGIFSLDELCDLLHNEYEYASLHRNPGNDRRRFKQRLTEILANSILFDELLDGRFKTNSEKGLLSRFNKGHNQTSWFEIPDKKILTSKKQFFDFCVGSLLAGNKFRANKNIAEFCGCSVRRIQFATSRNHKSGSFIKRYNFVEDFTGTHEDVVRFRAILFNVHGISSPLPRKHKKEWVVRLNAPNTYKAYTLCGIKGDWAQPLVVRVRKKEPSWFIPVPTEGNNAKLSDDSDKRWFFNDKVYNTNKYIQDNSKYLS